MVKLLRDAIPELDIFEAASFGDVGRVQTLLGDPQNATSRSGDGFTPLHLAAFFSQPSVAKLLIASGADVQSVAENGSRVQPLHTIVDRLLSLDLVELQLQQ